MGMKACYFIDWLYQSDQQASSPATFFDARYFSFLLDARIIEQVIASAIGKGTQVVAAFRRLGVGGPELGQRVELARVEFDVLLDERAIAIEDRFELFPVELIVGDGAHVVEVFFLQARHREQP